MIGFTNAGGFDRLKLRVFGGTSAPSSPQDNDIWIKTSTAILNWRITNVTNPGATSPTGLVYIVAGTDGDRVSTASLPTLNVLKQNNKILLNFKGCLQLISGKWQSMDAYCYKSGAWVQFSNSWDGTLYYNGNQYTSVTGGWKGAQTTTPYLEEVTGCKPWNNDYNEGVICTANAIDLTNWKTLHIIGGGGGKDSESKYPMKAYVRKTYTGEDVATADFGDTALDSNTQRDVDISGLSGSYYILTGAAGNIRHSHRVVRVWLTA